MKVINLIDHNSKKIEYLDSNLYHWKNDGKFEEQLNDHSNSNFDYFESSNFLEGMLKIVEVEDIYILSIQVDGTLEEEIEVFK